LGERLVGARFVDDHSGGFIFGEEGEAEQEEREGAHGGKKRRAGGPEGWRADDG
jgi:hypothetical protein